MNTPNGLKIMAKIGMIYRVKKLAHSMREGPPAEYIKLHGVLKRTIEFIREKQDVPWFFSFNCFDPPSL